MYLTHTTIRLGVYLKPLQVLARGAICVLLVFGEYIPLRSILVFQFVGGETHISTAGRIPPAVDRTAWSDQSPKYSKIRPFLWLLLCPTEMETIVWDANAVKLSSM